MPTYTFICQECGTRQALTTTVRRYRKLTENEELVCSWSCEGTLRRDYKADNVRIGSVPGTGNAKHARELEEKARRVIATPDKEVRDSMVQVYGADSQQVFEWDHGRQ